MKKLYIIANWKSYKTTQEALEWLTEAQKMLAEKPLDKEKVLILCAPFTLLSLVSQFKAENNLPIAIGVQDISPFGMGAYTGEINSLQAKEFATYALIGHSERRRYFGETDEMLAKKVEQALSQQITPMLCVTEKTTPVPNTVVIAGYEPVTAIGSGQPDTPENANEVATFIKSNNPHVQHVLYGGSVIPENVASFTRQENIDGVIIGGASLDPKKLLALAYNA
ncbi:MAG TPA: triose-phosphate isomerase family protein [Patescibacteria group bacterium]